MLDVLIIGAGPAGVSAAIYLKRFNIDVTVLNTNQSALHTAHCIENYYGFPSITGADLFELGLEQLDYLKVPVINEEVLSIENYSSFVVTTKNNVYNAKKVILATGKARNKLNVLGLKEFETKGVSYCATCDGFFYRDQKIGIVGSGDHMLHELDFLKNITKDIIIFSNGEHVENDEFLVVESKIKSLYGADFLEGVETVDARYDLVGLFVAIGNVSTFDFINRLGILTKNNNIVVDENYQTNIKNLYAIGDAIGGVLQIAKGVYDGMMVAHKIRNEGK